MQCRCGRFVRRAASSLGLFLDFLDRIGKFLGQRFARFGDLVLPLFRADVALVRNGLSRGFSPFEISLLAAAWIVPLLSRSVAGLTGIPLGLLVLLTLYVFTLRRAVLDPARSAAHGLAQA